ERRSRFVHTPLPLKPGQKITPDDPVNDAVDLRYNWRAFRENLQTSLAHKKDQYWFDFITNFQWMPGDNFSDVMHDIIKDRMVEIGSDTKGSEVYYAPANYTLVENVSFVMVEPFAVAVLPNKSEPKKLDAMAILFSSDDAVRSGRQDHDALIFQWVPGQSEMPYMLRREIGGLNGKVFSR